MIKRNQTAVPAGSEPDAFEVLHQRFMSVTWRLEVLDQISGGCGNLPRELHPAALVLNETTEEAVQLHEDFEIWHATHEHTPKAKAVQS